MSEKYRKYKFWAKTTDGRALKGAFEFLQNTLSDISLSINKDEIRMVECVSSNDRLSIFISMVLQADNFTEYYCKTPMTIGLNIIHLHKTLKEVKNGDTVTFFIRKDDENKFVVSQTEKNDPMSMSQGYVGIQRQSAIGVQIPNDSFYGHPIHVPTKWLQKVSKGIPALFKNKGGENVITIQSKGKYICIKSGMADLLTGEYTYGDEPEGEEEYSEKFSTKSLIFNKVNCSNTVKVYFPQEQKESYPIKLYFTVSELGSITTYLKPLSELR